MSEETEIGILIRMATEASLLKGFSKQIADNIDIGLKRDSTGYDPKMIRERIKFMKKELASIEKYLDKLQKKGLH